MSAIDIPNDLPPYERATAEFRWNVLAENLGPYSFKAIDQGTGEPLFYVDIVKAESDGSIPRDRYSEIQAKVRDKRDDAPTLLYVADGDHSGFLKYPEVVERDDSLTPATGLADRERLKAWYRGRLEMAT